MTGAFERGLKHSYIAFVHATINHYGYQNDRMIQKHPCFPTRGTLTSLNALSTVLPVNLLLYNYELAMLSVIKIDYLLNLCSSVSTCWAKSRFFSS